MSKFYNYKLKKLRPYQAGFQPLFSPGLIKLNTNENPYPPSPKVAAALQRFPIHQLRYYPELTADSLRQKLSQHHQDEKISPQQIFVGNGSDEVLALAFQSFFENQSQTDRTEINPVLFPDLTYSFYPVYAMGYNILYEEVKVKGDFSIDLAGYNQNSGGIVLANPNAPTGLTISLDDIASLCERHQEHVVLIDEAYGDFWGQSAAALIHRFSNLLVVKTFSKSWSLAGLRVGYAIGNEDLIQGLLRAKDAFNSYPIDTLAITLACEALEDKAYFEKNLHQIRQTRDKTREALLQLGLGLEINPSQTNFLLVKIPDHQAANLAQALQQKNIFIRHFANSKIEDFLRISIGTPAEMTTLIENIKEIMLSLP